MIIDVCAVVPRLMVVIGLKMLMGDAFDDDLLVKVNNIVWVTCYGAAFVVVEVVVPWLRDGSTPAGMFYRMSCETRKRTGPTRAAFYALRAAALLIVLRYPLLAAPALAVFYLVARQMPYDFIPAISAATGEGGQAAQGPEGAEATDDIPAAATLQ